MTRPPNDERTALPDEHLLRAYRAADYRVSGHLLHIDQPHPDFDRQLERLGVQTYVLLTAYNPRSTPLPDPVNRARHLTLLELVEGRQLGWLPASGADPAQDWQEEIGICLLDPRPADARELARLYEQHAIVEGFRGGAPVLYWL